MSPLGWTSTVWLWRERPGWTGGGGGAEGAGAVESYRSVACSGNVCLKKQTKGTDHMCYL